MTDDSGAYEEALRRLPLAYSLALRLREMGVATEVVCEYLGVQESALAGLYRLAEAKLAAATRAVEPGPPATSLGTLAVMADDETPDAP